jgi:signal transduction histidine kinase
MNNKSSLPILLDTISKGATLLLYELGAFDPGPWATGPWPKWRLEEIQKLDASLEQRVAQGPDAWEDAFMELDASPCPVFLDPPGPLRHVDYFLDILAQSLGSDHDAEATPGRDRAKVASQRLVGFLEELLAFSRLGRQTLVPGPVCLDRLVADLAEACTGELKGWAVTWRFSPLPILQADPDLVRTGIRQLIDNAIKATRARERPAIQVGCAPGPKGYRTLCVRDNGVGFDPARAHLLFGVFQHRPRSGPFQGAGLGLASVQRIVQRHGGRVWAESEPGHGATFYLAFPDFPSPHQEV